MTESTIDCPNCGRPNPAWAQICRSCGFGLTGAAPAARPPARIPTDQKSLFSMIAALVIIALGVFAGMSVANLDPTRAEPIAEASVEPTPRPTPRRTPAPSLSVAPEPSPSPSPSPTPDLVGRVSFGRGLDGAQGILEPTTQFGPNTPFAHSIELEEPFGVPAISEEVVRLEADGSETVLQNAADTALGVNPDSTVAGFSIPSAGPLLEQWGPGNYILRIYRGEELIAEGTFTLVP